MIFAVPAQRTGIMALGIMLWLIPIQTPAETQEPFGPVTARPSASQLTGKVVWVDLVSSDLDAASGFYQAVFGWDISRSRDGSFANVSYRGAPLATFSKYQGDKAPDGEARWLISISVADVDAAAAAVTGHGGKVLDGPEDLAGRGRYVLVEDNRGALLMLLKSVSGDPVDEAAVDNTWVWAELWTDDPEASVGFYEKVVGYRSKSVRDESGDEVLVLGHGNVARASVTQSPWSEVAPNWLTWLRVADVAATTRAVLEHGGEVVIAPMRDSDGSWLAVVADSTGGVFAIQQRREH